MQSARGQHPLYRTETVLDGSQMSNDISGYIEVLFISIGRMTFLAPSFDNANSLFALVQTRLPAVGSL